MEEEEKLLRHCQLKKNAHIIVRQQEDIVKELLEMQNIILKNCM